MQTVKIKDELMKFMGLGFVLFVSSFSPIDVMDEILSLKSMRIYRIVWIVVVIGIIYSFIIAGIGAYENRPHDELISEETPLLSLQDGNTIEGAFFLGCGHINGVMKYSLYIRTDEGGIKMQQLPVDDTLIYEDEESNPYILEYNLWDVSPSGDILSKSSTDWWEYPYYELHVPLGTVIQEYNLDGS